MTRYYPVYLNLEGRRCVVVGAGPIAERKAEQLLNAGAAVTVISPEATEAIEAWEHQGRLTWTQRRYRHGDLAGAFLTIAATADSATNRVIHAEAQAAQVLVNVVDVPELCSFIAPAVVQRGPVTVAISTSGSSPALARRLRELMDGTRPIDCREGATTCRCLAWADAAELLASVRTQCRADGVAPPAEAWQEAMDAEFLRLLEGGQETEARERLRAGLLRATAAKGNPCA